MLARDLVKAPVIRAIGYSDDRDITHFGPSVRNQYIIHYVLSGKGIFNGNTVKRGEGFLITPGLYEEYHADENDPWAFLWIISEDPSIEYFFTAHNSDPVTGIFKFHNQYCIDDIARELCGVYNAFSSCAKLTELFLRIFSSSVARDKGTATSTAKEYFDFSVNYIKANLHLGIKVEDLCRAVGITQPYLYRIFKEEAGCSPKRYISKMRIREARSLLDKSKLSISLIASSLGFGSVTDFSKFFSKETGLSPTLYRSKTDY